MRFSASSLPLLVNCAHSARPGVSLEKDKMGPAAMVGNAVHRLAEWSLTGQPADVTKACALESVKPEDVERVRRLWANLADWLAVHASADAMAEVAYAYNPVTGASRILGYGIGRNYREHGQREEELAGTADMVAAIGDTLHVYDWKTGKSDAGSYRWQLRMLGLAALNVASPLTRAVIHVVRVSEVEVDDSWSESMQDEDLCDVTDEISRVWNETPHAEPKAGLWCEANYCRARKGCAGYRAWRQ